jgi:hypothetical protein
MSRALVAAVMLVAAGAVVVARLAVVPVAAGAVVVIVVAAAAQEECRYSMVHCGSCPQLLQQLTVAMRMTIVRVTMLEIWSALVI